MNADQSFKNEAKTKEMLTKANPKSRMCVRLALPFRATEMNARSADRLGVSAWAGSGAAPRARAPWWALAWHAAARHAHLLG